MIGSGSLSKDLQDFVAELNLSDKVEFKGWIDVEEIPLWHDKIDIFVNISLNESFGVSVIEASSAKTPVVVSEVGG